jgi:tetratricopeptide (TPR) repeat protein
LDERGTIPWDVVFDMTPASPEYNEANRQGAFYAQSWLLVHYLGASDERTRQLGRYLTLLRSGGRPDESFAGAFDVTRAEMGKRAEDYLGELLRTGRGYYYRMDLGEQLANVETATRELEPAEVLFRLGDLLARTEQRESAKRHLEAALEAGWSEAPVHSALGFAAWGADDLAQAESQFRQAIAAGSAEVEPHVLLAQIELDQWSEGDGARRFFDRTPDELLHVRSLLEPFAEDFEALTTLGRTYLFGNDDVAPGVEAVARASTIRPLAPDTILLQACLLARQGRPVEAWSLIDRGLRPRHPAVAEQASGCASEATIFAVWQRLEARDLPAARQVLADALRSASDAEVVRQLESFQEVVDSGGRIVFVDDSPDEDDRVSRLNAAIDRANAGDHRGAVAGLEELVAQCAGETEHICKTATEQLQQLRETVEYNQAIAAYNEAIALANTGDRKRAIEVLRRLESEVEQPELLAAVQDLLRALGARVKKR